ncbi:MAG: DUF433 domain-containing protein [Microcystis viridis Mv_BB_P_19951000_S69]|jgi:uncharacterized protein (DUF433 family)|uniref:DUF433 domain-containing protein n=1 Tax=Microcystis viridis Mv_BB_P_19951000_S68D TaxID=2486270 RepID=A0A552HN05_MICVR|nr:MAG: DUF433 domain-containing protein [Microcystis viridis Mv_BB_P_19951000_S69]TRU72603.1 MAG: DUF433 domain-containing protein [Microcystis viridis Mv_BB_P_19951000_S68D]TRU79020.1 MAG: DUF433 domain-containing protein [Microcystis viridis Mv_BB_P_19951000_S68]TRU89287.1 MAG: DUF433 domain-containing protein [Microcystis viridis Mv_BB_P_19951000_S69D]
MKTKAIIHSDPDILGGTPVFKGTRVPIKTLLDYLEAGDSLDVFLDHFPSVSKEQAIASLELAVKIGWSGKKNGELLKLISQNGFTILLTTDQNLRYEQNLQQAGIAVIVLVAPTNKISDLLPLMPDVRNVLNTIATGEFIEIISTKSP